MSHRGATGPSPMANAPHRTMRNVCTPGPVRPGDGQVPQKMRIYLVLRVFPAGPGLLMDGQQPHRLHQPTHAMPPAFVPFPLHVAGHPLADRALRSNVPRGWREPCHGGSGNWRSLSADCCAIACRAADDRHEGQVLRAFAARLAAKARAPQGQQAALPPHAEAGMILLHRDRAPVPGMRLEASGKKPRSITNWPILACSFPTSAGDISGPDAA